VNQCLQNKRGIKSSGTRLRSHEVHTRVYTKVERRGTRGRPSAFALYFASQALFEAAYTSAKHIDVTSDQRSFCRAFILLINFKTMPGAAPPVPEKCSTCGMEFSTRNKLFKHLREPSCFVEVKPPPSEADGDAGSRPKRRLVLACGFVGDAFPSVGRTLEEDAAAEGNEEAADKSPLDSRPSLETILIAAVNSACGYDAVISFDPAVTTEKGESASRNVLVFGLVKLRPGEEAGNEGPADGSPLPPAFLAALQSAMPPQVWLLQSPRLLPPHKRALAGVARSVACQSHAFAIPYACLVPAACTTGSLPLPCFDATQAVQISDSDASNGNNNRQPANDNDLFLMGFPEETTTSQMLLAAVEEAYRLDAAPSTKDASPASEPGTPPGVTITMYKGGWCTVTRRDGQPFSDGVLARLSGSSLGPGAACVQDNTRSQRGDTANKGGALSMENNNNNNALVAAAFAASSLVALRWHEARVKLAIWAKLKHGLKILSTGRGFQNFLKPGSMLLNRGMKLFINGHVDSKTVLRSAIHDNIDDSSGSGSSGVNWPASSSWLAREWCVIIFDGPRTLGCELLRRLAGTLVAYCRGTENESYLLRCHSNAKSGAVTTPRAPTASMCLIGFELDPIRRGQGGREAASLRCQGDDDAVEVAAWAARGCGNGGGSTMASEESSNGAAVLAECLTRADARKAWESMCANIDSGEATRGADNARLREASRTGDMQALKTLLAGAVSEGNEEDDVAKSSSDATSVPLYSSIDARDEYGRTALFLAAQNGHSKAVELLLKQGARLQAAVAFGGCSAVIAAQAAGHHAVVKILQDAAASAAAVSQPTAATGAVPKAAVMEGFAEGPLVEATSSWRPEQGTAAGDVDAESCSSQLSSQLTGLSLQEPAHAGDSSVVVRELLPQRRFPGHPGCGSIEIDHAVTDHEAQALITLWRDYLPEVLTDYSLLRCTICYFLKAWLAYQIS